MTLFLISMIAVGLVSFVAYAWLVVVAFRTRLLWGFLVLFFSPITAIVFAIYYWDEARKPFLVYAGSGAAYLAFMGYFFFSMGGLQMIELARQVRSGEMSEETAKRYIGEQIDRMEHSRFLSKGDKEDLAKIREKFDEIKKEDSTKTRTLITISTSKASEHIGQTMRVMSRDGLNVEGKLVRIDRDIFVFRKTVDSGQVEFQVGEKEITSLQVYR